MWSSIASVQTAILVLATFCIWTLDQRGSLDRLDGWAFDSAVQFTAPRPQADPFVTLVMVEPDNSWPDVFERILAFQPAGVGLLTPPPDNVLPLLEKNRNRVVLPSHHRVDDANVSTVVRARSSDIGEANVLQNTPSADGVLRWHESSVRVDGHLLPSFEATLARLSDSDLPIPGRFRVGFRGKQGSLPVVTAGQLVAGQLIPELFRSRLVLVGPRTPVHDSGFTVPFSGKSRVSACEYHGQVVNSMLSGATVQDLPPLYRLGFLFFVSSTLVIVHDTRKTGVSLKMLALICGLTLLTCLLLLSWHRMWLRPMPFLLSQFSCVLFLWDRRLTQIRNELNRLSLDFATQTRLYKWPVWFFTANNPWQHVAEVYNQMLSPNRIVLLKSAPNRLHVQATVYVGCGKDAILERRRDYRRTPYSTAVQENRPILIDPAKSFLKPNDDEAQYLVGLRCHGELLGFCAVCVDAAAVNSKFVDDLWRISNEVAAMLYHRRELDRGRTRGKRGTLSEPSDGTVTGSLQQIAEAMRVATGKRIRVEDIYREGVTPSLVLDLYGNQVMANRSLLDLLGEENISDKDQPPTRLLAELLGRGEEQIRLDIRRAVIAKEPRKAVESMAHSQRPFCIEYRPVKAKLLGNAEYDIYPFQIVGVRVDLAEMRLATEMDWLQLSATEAPVEELT